MKQLQLPQSRNYILFFILVSFLFSCNIKDTKEIIPFMKNELKSHKKEMLEINNWINKQNYDRPYWVDIIRAKERVYVCYKGKKGHDINNKDTADYIYNFFQTSSFDIIGVYSDVIEYGNKFRNPDFRGYDLVNIYDEPEKVEKYKGYKFYNIGNKPKEISGWIYHLEENWYIRSPFPKKKKK